MLVKGFKTWGENVSLQIRREVGLRDIEPLSPQTLAAYLKVPIWIPENIEGLRPESLHLLLGEERDSWSAVTVSSYGYDVIIPNSSHSKVRQSNSIMHELSHVFLGHDPGKMLISQNGQILLRTYSETQEDEVNWLSGCLLLPRPALISIKRSDMGNPEACELYAVSHDLLNYRLNVTGVNKQFKR